MSCHVMLSISHGYYHINMLTSMPPWQKKIPSLLTYAFPFNNWSATATICHLDTAANRGCSQLKSLNTKPLTIFTASASFLRAAAFTTCHRSTPSLTPLPGHKFQFQQTTPEYSFLPHLFAPHHLQHIAHGRVDTIAGQPTFQHCACTPQLRRHGFAPGGLHRKKAGVLDFLLCFFYVPIVGTSKF